MEGVLAMTHKEIERNRVLSDLNERKITQLIAAKKLRLSERQIHGEFVASMEDVLATYAMPYNKAIPVICMDEQPVQLLKETRQAIPATINHPQRVDYEYERGGSASIFMFTEPLSRWRAVKVRPQRKKIDWAQEIEELLRTKYEKVEKIILVCDNLNTHTHGAFYEAFLPEKAREIVKPIEFRYTPKHGSWLNIAENELSGMTRKCLNKRRIGDIITLQEEVEAWANPVNDSEKGVDWQFTINDARLKLKSIYHKIKY